LSLIDLLARVAIGAVYFVLLLFKLLILALLDVHSTWKRRPKGYNAKHSADAQSDV